MSLTAELDGNYPARRPRAVSEDHVTGVNGHVLVDEGDHVGGSEGDGEDGRLHGAHQADLCSGKDRGQIISSCFFLQRRVNKGAHR